MKVVLSEQPVSQLVNNVFPSDRQSSGDPLRESLRLCLPMKKKNSNTIKYF